MDDEEIAKLQDEDEWDFESAVRQRTPRGRRAIVSVGFKSADFATVAAAAEKRDQPVSQFIREAALDRARGRAAESVKQQILSISVVKAPPHIEAQLLDAMRSQERLSALR